jgi:glycosyl transferase family 25
MEVNFYCINLKHKINRWEQFSSQPAYSDIKGKYPFERVDAVQGTAIEVMDDSRISERTRRNIIESQRRDHEDINTLGAVGCYLSHIGIWKRMVTNNIHNAVIFEDDTRLPSDFLEKFESALEEFKTLSVKADLWTFSYPWSFYYKVKSRPLPQDVPDNYRGDWLYNTTPGGLNGYFITQEGAKKLLQHALPIEMHVDIYICMSADLERITCVANKNVIVSVLSAGLIASDIQAGGCTVCNIPNEYHREGYALINIQSSVIAAAVLVGVLFFAGRYYK